MTKKEKLQSIIRPEVRERLLDVTESHNPNHRNIQDSAGKSFIGQVQSRLKKYEALYGALVRTFGPVKLSRSFKEQLASLFAAYSSDHVILNIGSGPDHLSAREDVINMDIFPFKNVDVLADATDMPIVDKSVDLIICVAMLEHVPKPQAVIHECMRVLRPGGLMISYLPFIQPGHAAPDDYLRWAPAGVLLMPDGFEVVKTGIGAGPTSGFLWVFEEWVAMLLSLGSRRIHDIILLLIMPVLSPLKLLDICMERLPNADKIASGFYVVARKR